MSKVRLDYKLFVLGIVNSRSQAESWIKLGKVTVNGKVIKKTGYQIKPGDEVKLISKNQYVSRAGLKLESVADKLQLEFNDKIILDVGSSTGGFSDFAIQNGAKKVIAVDVGTDQLHKSLRENPKIELYEKTDIRKVVSLVVRGSSSADLTHTTCKVVELPYVPDIILIDVSFISLREILPHIRDNLADGKTQIVAMLKPQFEAGKNQVNKGIIKNDSIRRTILHDFEAWVKNYFVILDKSDSQVSGAKGNKERFYLLKKV